MRTRPTAATIFGAGVICAGLFFAGSARAAEITVLASAAVKEAYNELVPGFERSTEHKVATTWAGTVDMLKRLQGGEVFDIVIMAGPAIDDFIKQGKIVPGSRVDLAKSGVGVAVKTGAAKPDISSGDAVKRAMLAAKSIAYSTGPSGVYMAALFQRMGIADEIKGKVKITPPGVPVGELIARGEAEIGFQQVSELLPVAGIDMIGPLPPDVQQITVFAGGIHTGATHADAAKALLQFLSAPAAAPVLKKKGLEPG
jgi:molybdate transport system substrate-binding protein